MKTKGKVSRVTAFFMTLLMAVSLLCATAFAIEPDEKGTITVNDVEDNVTVSAYRLMDVKVNENGQPQEPVYTWTDEVAAWVRKNYPTYIGEAEDNSVQDDFSTEAETEEIAEFYDALAAAIKTTEGPLDITAADTRNGSGTIEDLSMGNYLILIENGMKVYRPSAVNLVPVWDTETDRWEMSDATVVVKSSELTISKTVNADTGSDSAGKKADNANIGDTVSFEIVADVPNFPANALAKNYAVSDILPEGLTLDEDSIEVYGVSGDMDTPLEAGDSGAYTSENTRPNNGVASSFTLTFAYDKISSYEKIRVTYSAVLNGDAVLGTLGNVNNAHLDYSNNPYVAESWKDKKHTPPARARHASALCPGRSGRIPKDRGVSEYSRGGCTAAVFRSCCGSGCCGWSGHPGCPQEKGVTGYIGAGFLIQRPFFCSHKIIPRGYRAALWSFVG